MTISPPLRHLRQLDKETGEFNISKCQRNLNLLPESFHILRQIGLAESDTMTELTEALS